MGDETLIAKAPAATQLVKPIVTLPVETPCLEKNSNK
jgi:hypothetical protein